MNHLVVYDKNTIAPLLNDRLGEDLWANRLGFVDRNADLGAQLAAAPGKFVLFGICEDIGVRANYGRPGAANAWPEALKRLVNIQVNPDNDLPKATLLGHLDFADFEEEMNQPAQPAAYGPWVQRVDEAVSQLVLTVVAAGKIPLAIGGGHNNAYGMIKGCAQALGRGINALNIDAHADLRPMDYRHSGNGFTYALHEGLLQRYFAFGLHENYNSRSIYEEMLGRPDRVGYATYESMYVRGQSRPDEEADRALAFVRSGGFGLEIDLDCVEHMPSSALTPSGLSAAQTRGLAHTFATDSELRYVHLCEAAPRKGNDTEEIAVGKFITYLVSDVLRAAR